MASKDTTRLNETPESSTDRRVGSDVPTSTAADSASEFSGEDLVIGYPASNEPTLDGESIHVSPGEVTALVGPNGSGKSTLLKGLANQLALDDGTVLLDGVDIHSLTTKELARELGLLSQENVSPGSLSVENLIEHGRYPYRGFFEAMTSEDEAAIDRAISLAGVEHLRERPVGSLSGGQKQRVWIAMVLAQDTDVLLLDEPTTFLDLHHQLEVIEIVETLAERPMKSSPRTFWRTSSKSRRRSRPRNTARKSCRSTPFTSPKRRMTGVFVPDDPSVEVRLRSTT